MRTNAFQDNLVGKATLTIAVFSLLAKLLGLARDAVFSHQFGASGMIDAYFAAFRVPDFIYNLLILGTFSVAFIPVFSEYRQKSQGDSNRLASSIINVTLIMMLGLTLLAFIFVTPLTKAIAPGFSGEQFELTKLFTKIFLFSPLFLTLSSILSSILNTYKRFTLVAIAPVVYNVSIIAGALWLYPAMGPKGLALGVLIGAFLHFVIQVPQVFKIGFRYSVKIVTSDDGFKKFWKLYWPRIFSMGTEQVTGVIVSIFGSFLGAGALAAFYYSNNLQSVFLGIFAVSFAIAVFPLLSDLHNKKDDLGFKDVLAKTTVQILFFIIPLSILLLVLRAQAVRLVLGIGEGTQFSFANTKLVAESLGLFSISLFAQALIPLFNRAFYAMQNTITPVVISLLTVTANIFITYFLTGKIGVAGMALAYSLTSILNLTLLMMELHRRLGNIHDEYLIINSLKIVIASLIAGTGAFSALYAVAPMVDMQTYLGVLVQGITAGIAGITLYLVAGYILNISETRGILGLIRTTGSKLGKPINIIWNWWS